MRQAADDTKVGVGKSEPVVEGGEPVVPAPFLTVERYTHRTVVMPKDAHRAQFVHLEMLN